MKARDVIGRRIAAVEQERVPCTSSGHDFVMKVTALVLDDGTRIEFRGVEIEYGDPVAEATAVKLRRKP